MIHSYFCSGRHCGQCDDCLAEGESKYCCSCCDYMEIAHYNARKRREEDASHNKGSKVRNSKERT